MSTLVSLPGATPAAAPDYQSLERPLNFTESAAAKVKSLIQEEGNPDLALRVYIEGGGCSGFQTGSSSTRTVPRTIWRYRPAG